MLIILTHLKLWFYFLTLRPANCLIAAAVFCFFSLVSIPVVIIGFAFLMPMIFKVYSIRDIDDGPSISIAHLDKPIKSLLGFIFFSEPKQKGIMFAFKLRELTLSYPRPYFKIIKLIFNEIVCNLIMGPLTYTYLSTIYFCLAVSDVQSLEERGGVNKFYSVCMHYCWEMSSRHDS